MKETFSISLRMLLIMTAVTGILYPVALTVVGKAIAPESAEGSMITVDGKLAGSSLIAQRIQDPRYFWTRPSAIDYNPLPSGASNYGPTSAQLRKAVQERRIQFLKQNGLSSEVPVPLDMIFASGSGLDPHITPSAAALQIDRIATARGFNQAQKERLRALVSRFTEQPQFGILGQARVNVLQLDIALDQLN